MLGVAQKLFFERSLMSLSQDLKKTPRWPLLEQMLLCKRVGYVDLALAAQLLGKNDEESLAALICHLSLSARRGHVCVKFNGHAIQPSVNEIWISDEIDQAKGISAGNLKKLTALILEGIQKIEFPLISIINGSDPVLLSPIVKNKNCFYLQRYWQYETVFLRGVKQKLFDEFSVVEIDLAHGNQQIDAQLCQNKLLVEQAEAIKIALKSSLTLITGGPGTGKTYTAGILLRIFWDSLPEKLRSNLKIVLAAPTGKAAANLEKSIQHHGVEGFPSLKAQTLHQLLGIRKNTVHREIPILTADLIIVDESSMIDIRMMGQLFSALKPGSRLILLGDKNQLPSIEAGSLFADLINYFSFVQSHVAELKTCLRAEFRSIIELADLIKVGNDTEVIKLLKSDQEGIKFVELDSERTIQEQQKKLLNYAVAKFPLIKKLPDNPLDLLKQFSQFRILTPVRKGGFGVEALNALILQAMQAKSKNGCFIAPIMVTQNNYKLGLFNGEVGLIVKEKDAEFALFPSREPGKDYYRIPAILMPPFEYAYCLSVHKSQGSEFDHVVLLLPEDIQTFGREALYTGVTRAKRQLEIWGNPHVLSQMIGSASVRQSGIVERLKDV